MASSARIAKARIHTKRGLWRHLYVQLIGVATLLLLLQFLLAQHPIVEPVVTQLDDLQKRRLDIYLDLIKLLITGGGVALGAITGFVLNRDKAIAFTPEQRRKIVASWVLGGVSLYCGYWSIDRVDWMLTNNFFDLYLLQVWLPGRAQFLTLLAAIAVFADFIYTSLNTKGETSDHE
jgi:hypothetical protein